MKRLWPSFGGAARFNPGNIEKVSRNAILSYLSKKAKERLARLIST
ncbi:hypothetical protein [Paenibacillus sp. FSL H8-0537]